MSNELAEAANSRIILNKDDLPILIHRTRNQDFPYIKIEVDRNPDYPMENITKTQEQILKNQAAAILFDKMVEEFVLWNEQYKSHQGYSEFAQAIVRLLGEKYNEVSNRIVAKGKIPHE